MERARPERYDDVVRRLVVAGTDHRARLGRVSGRNAYGCAPWPRAVPFGACSASEPDADLLELARDTVGDPAPLSDRYDAIRTELVALLGLPTGTTVALTPSGTDAVYLAVAHALARHTGPVASVIVGSEEVGRGTIYAAAGLHFSATPPRPDTGRRVGLALRGWPVDRTVVEGLPLRDERGEPLGLPAIDALTRDAMARHRAAGRHVLLHANAGSKTGLRGPTDALSGRLDGATLLVDAAQGRLPPAEIAAYVARGAMVVLTGSKFYGAPAFAGALLLPPGVDGAGDHPEGLGDYLCDQALPGHPSPGEPWENDGLWFRWQLGLMAMRRYLAIPADDRAQVGARFAAAVPVALASSRLSVEPDDDASPTRIVTLGVHGAAGRLGLSALQEAHEALCDEGILLGQPVTLAPDRVALRLSLSAPLVTRLAAAPDHGAAWLATHLGAVRDALERFVARRP